jgi:flagellar biogenesis protein FliO
MDLVRQSLAILFVFLLLWAALWFLRKKDWPGLRRSKIAPGLLEARGKLALTPRHSIHLVGVGGRTLVLALHPDGVTFLGDAAPEASSERKATATL